MKHRTLFLLAVAAISVTCMLLAGVALAQSAPLPPPSVDDLARALSGHQWTVCAGIAVYFVVAFAKQGWFSAWLAAKVPKTASPVVAVLLSEAGMAGLEIFHGAVWWQALLQAFEAAAIAVFAHQTFVEGMRNGKELLPRAPWAR